MQEYTGYDRDLVSVQESRRLAVEAREAQRAFFHTSQEQVDRICAAMAEAAYRNSERLGQMAHEETGYGVPAHKALKNKLGSQGVWDSIKDTPTVGVLRRDEEKKIVEIGWPVGVVACLVPSTNPTSTVMYKVLIAVKARNAAIIAPHPSARKCCLETVRIMAEAGEKAGMPKGLVSCIENLSLEGTQELMRHYAVSLILATGGTPMVRAAHSVGKPAIGVGPGNVPVYVDRSADVAKAASDIVNSKAFDCSVICATEQAVVADAPIAEQLRAEMKKNGAYWLEPEQQQAVARCLFDPSGAINPRSVGKTPQAIAELAGITVPAWARVLVADLKGVGKDYPLSREKLTTALGFYVEKDWHAGCERCIELLKFGGDGHSLVIHARDEEVILAFGIEKPAFRIMVNTWGSMGAVGSTTGLMPSMTLAPGGIGGSIVSDNISVQHLLNIKRLAYETGPPPAEACSLAQGVVAQPTNTTAPGSNANPSVSDAAASRSAGAGYSADDIAQIVREVLKELKA